MDIASQESYRSIEGYTPSVFGVGGSATAKHLRREHTGWQEHSDIEGRVENHCVLIVGPASAKRLAP